MPNIEPENMTVEKAAIEKGRVHVVAGVIYNVEGSQILIALRPQHAHQGGLWEFPGGKVDVLNHESPEQALCRELKEELALTIDDCQPLLKVRHDYPDKSVFLDVWKVSAFTGEPVGNEGQTIAWVHLNELDDYNFPAANQAILAAIAQTAAS